jgi:hypothetical protein
MKTCCFGQRRTSPATAVAAFSVALAVAFGSAQGQSSSTPPAEAQTSGADANKPNAQQIPVSPENPVYVEALFGSDRFDLETLISKRFFPTGKASILSVTNVQGQHTNSTDSFDFVNVTQLSYDLYKGVGVNVGLSFNRQIGFNTIAGVQYVHASPKVLFVFSPSVFLTGSHDVQNVVVASYQPTLSHHWRLYESAQVFDDYVVSLRQDERRFVHARTGASYNLFTFGFGTDFDWYGIPYSYRSNYGPFAAYSF